MLSRSFGAAGAFALALLGFACSSTTVGTLGGASPEQVSSCKRSCDKMKFFDCNSAEEQAACYSDCDKATPAQVEVFTGCADNSICDTACRTTIQPKAPP